MLDRLLSWVLCLPEWIELQSIPQDFLPRVLVPIRKILNPAFLVRMAR